MINQTAILETAPVGFVPNYYLYIAVGITILAVIVLTYVYRSKNGIKFQNFWKVMSFVIVISGIITIGLAIAPEILTNLIDKVGGWWANL